MLSLIFIMASDLFEWKRICAFFVLLFVYIDIAVQDTIISCLHETTVMHSLLIPKKSEILWTITILHVIIAYYSETW